MSENSDKKLSANDEAILKNIFIDAEPLSFNNTCYHKTSLDDLKGLFNENQTADENSIKALELQGIQQAENGQLVEAIKTFTKAIQIAPSLRSPYNNRAQAYRVLEDDSAALDDIKKVIELTKEKDEIYCKALCQRGILHFKQRRDVDAVTDFQEAASLGSEFAKEQMVKLNPYATLCNATLKKVFESLK